MCQLVIVTELNLVRVSGNETKTDAPLIVDGDRILPKPITLQRVKAVPWGDSKIGKLCGNMNSLKPS